MNPENDSENACPPMTTFQRIMKTPNNTSSNARIVRLMVRPGSSSRMNGTRLPSVYCRMKILKKSLVYMTSLRMSQDFMAV